MRICMITLLTLFLSLRAAATASEPFPYIAHVTAESTSLRSGPGEDYYETSVVARGAPVEVWREAPGGWLAVRPPKESFSLVAAADVRLAPDRLAEAVRPDTPARIGSELTADRDVVQVLLNQGERVRVLETTSLDGQFWHRVAPPAGEFRWIHAAAVSGAASSFAPTVPETFLPEQNEPAPYRIARFSSAAEEQAASSHRIGGAETAPRTLADAVQSPTSQYGDEAAVTSTDIEVELATIVAEESQMWHFAHLRSRCEELLTSSDPTLRQEFQAILNKITRFEQIRDRRRAISPIDESYANSPPNSVRLGNTTTNANPPQPAANEHESAAISSVAWRAAREETVREPAVPLEGSKGGGDVVRIPDRPIAPSEVTNRYDGIGTLRPVVSRRAEAPRYALVDAEGDVVSFITPSTGVNLQPYVGQRIGVVGTRGYMPEFKRAHVTAARVTPLR